MHDDHDEAARLAEEEAAEATAALLAIIEPKCVAKSAPNLPSHSASGFPTKAVIEARLPSEEERHTPAQRQVLDELRDDIERRWENPYEGGQLVNRCVTIIRCHMMHSETVLQEAAHALTLSEKGSGWRVREAEESGFLGSALQRAADDDFALNYCELRDEVEGRMREEDEGKPANLIFYEDEFVAMAQHVQNCFPGSNITASSERQFYNSGQLLDLHLVKSFIQRTLHETCAIRDRRTNAIVHISNQIIAQVCAALARQFPRLRGDNGVARGELRIVEGTTRIRVAAAASLVVEPRPVDKFVEEKLAATPHAWCSTDEVWGAWCECAEASGIPHGRREAFFRYLKRIVPGLRAERRRVNGVRFHGYSGISIL